MKKSFISLLVLSFFLYSCSMVKSPQSTSFKRVKYNAHLNLATASEKEKLPETVKSFEDSGNLEVSKSEPLEKSEVEELKNPLSASINSEVPKKAESNLVNLKKSDLNPKKKQKADLGLFGKTGETEKSISIKEYLNKPLPVAASDSSSGNLLYIILVVLLVLIILGLIGNIGGGIIGTLIAVLLILLILRLLGII